MNAIAKRNSSIATIAFAVAAAFGASPAFAVDSVTVPAATVQASIYQLYVSPTGSDSNSGSIQAPFRTISKAASVAKPSTTIHVAAGTYGNVINSKSGTSTGRIRFVSDTKWAAKIVGTGTESHFSNSGSYVDIVGFD